MPEDTFRWVITGAVAISTLCIFAMAVTAIVLYRLMSRLETKTEGMIERVRPTKGTLKEMMDQLERWLLIEALREGLHLVLDSGAYDSHPD